MYETEKTKSISVFCMGGKQLYDHPKIYLKINPESNEIHCPYCNKKFILESM